MRCTSYPSLIAAFAAWSNKRLNAEESRAIDRLLKKYILILVWFLIIYPWVKPWMNEKHSSSNRFHDTLLGDYDYWFSDKSELQNNEPSKSCFADMKLKRTCSHSLARRLQGEGWLFELNGAEMRLGGIKSGEGHRTVHLMATAKRPGHRSIKVASLFSRGSAFQKIRKDIHSAPFSPSRWHQAKKFLAFLLSRLNFSRVLSIL